MRRPLRRGTTPSRPSFDREETVFEGRIFDVVKRNMTLPDGHHAIRELVLHPGAVAIAAFDESGNILLVRQYRAAADDFLWEIPAGKLEPGERPLECAKRELAEETGLTAETWTEAFTFFTTPGFTDERITLFSAHSLEETSSRNVDEIQETARVSPRAFQRMILDGRIIDGKTLLAFFALVRDRLP